MTTERKKSPPPLRSPLEPMLEADHGGAGGGVISLCTAVQQHRRARGVAVTFWLVASREWCDAGAARGAGGNLPAAGARAEQRCIVRKKAVDSMLSVQQTSTIGSTSISAISSTSTSSGGAFSAAPSSVERVVSASSAQGGAGQAGLAGGALRAGRGEPGQTVATVSTARFSLQIYRFLSSAPRRADGRGGEHFARRIT